MKKIIICVLGVGFSVFKANAEINIHEIINNSQSNIEVVASVKQKEKKKVAVSRMSNKIENTNKLASMLSIPDDSLIVVRRDGGPVYGEFTKNDLQRRFGYDKNIKNFRIKIDSTLNVVIERTE